MTLANVIARARVVLSSLVTWIAVAVTVVAAMLPELLDVFGTDSSVAVLAGRGVALLTGVVAVIRKVTPVLDTAEGLLAADDTPVTSNEAHLRRELDALRKVVADYTGGR